MERVNKYFDKNLIYIFKIFCKEDSYVFVLGANIGLTVITLADILKKRKVAAVEPIQQSFEFLKLILKMQI